MSPFARDGRTAAAWAPSAFPRGGAAQEDAAQSDQARFLTGSVRLTDRGGRRDERVHREIETVGHRWRAYAIRSAINPNKESDSSAASRFVGYALRINTHRPFLPTRAPSGQCQKYMPRYFQSTRSVSDGGSARWLVMGHTVALPFPLLKVHTRRRFNGRCLANRRLYRI